MTRSTNIEAKIEKIIAEIHSIQLRRLLSQKELDVLPAMNLRGFLVHEIDNFVLEAVISFLALPQQRIYHDIRWPRDWREALKERWFPRWALLRWPVRYAHKIIDEQQYGPVCPHFNTDPLKTHVTFLCGLTKPTD